MTTLLLTIMLPLVSKLFGVEYFAKLNGLREAGVMLGLVSAEVTLIPSSKGELGSKLGSIIGCRTNTKALQGIQS